MKKPIWGTTLGKILIGLCIYSITAGILQFMFPELNEIIAGFGVLLEVGMISGILPAFIIGVFVLIVVIKGLTGSKTDKSAFAEGWAHKEPLIRAPFAIVATFIVIGIFVCALFLLK